MKIALLGATGGTGQSFINQAVANGHKIKALARTPLKLPTIHPNLETQAGNVFNIPSMISLFRGCDAVVSTFGISSIWQARKPNGLYSVGGENVLEAMKQSGVKRLVFVTSSGVEPQEDDGLFFRYVFKPIFLERMYGDMRLVEKKIHESQVDFTIVRPPYLTNGELTGAYRISSEGNFKDDKDLSRADPKRSRNGTYSPKGTRWRL